MSSRILENKVALVTGSDSGIGRAIAIAFAAEGARVVITYNSDQEGAAETAEEVKKRSKESPLVIQLDVTDEQKVNEAIDRVTDELGTLDVLVNNAGVNGSDIKLADMDTETFDQAIKTNLYGVFFCCRKFVQYLRSRNATGKIITISSVHETLASPGNVNYNASKSALTGFTKSLAMELAGEGTTVNNIAPGMILTPMNQEAIDDPETLKEQASHIPMKRAGKPEEIARLALFLASSDADYVTGASYFMDGGLTLNVGQGA